MNCNEDGVPTERAVQKEGIDIKHDRWYMI